MSPIGDEEMPKLGGPVSCPYHRNKDKKKKKTMSVESDMPPLILKRPPVKKIPQFEYENSREIGDEHLFDDEMELENDDDIFIDTLPRL